MNEFFRKIIYPKLIINDLIKPQICRDDENLVVVTEM